MKAALLTALTMTVGSFALAIGFTAASDQASSSPPYLSDPTETTTTTTAPVPPPDAIPVPAHVDADTAILFPNDNGAGQLVAAMHPLPGLLGPTPTPAQPDEGAAVTGWPDDPQPEPMPARAVTHEDPAPEGVSPDRDPIACPTS